jgi:hypothetical protein
MTETPATNTYAFVISCSQYISHWLWQCSMILRLRLLISKMPISQLQFHRRYGVS